MVRSAAATQPASIAASFRDLVPSLHQRHDRPVAAEIGGVVEAGVRASEMPWKSLARRPRRHPDFLVDMGGLVIYRSANGIISY